MNPGIKGVSSEEDDIYAQEAAEQKAYDDSYEEALRALTDKTTDPAQDRYDAGLHTLREAIKNKTGEDPEDR